MAIKNHDGEKFTPTQAAKHLVGMAVAEAHSLDSWREEFRTEGFTDKDDAEMDAAVGKQVRRVLKLMG